MRALLSAAPVSTAAPNSPFGFAKKINQEILDASDPVGSAMAQLGLDYHLLETELRFCDGPVRSERVSLHIPGARAIGVHDGTAYHPLIGCAAKSYTAISPTDLVDSLAPGIAEHGARIVGGYCYRDFSRFGIELSIPTLRPIEPVIGSVVDMCVKIDGDNTGAKPVSVSLGLRNLACFNGMTTSETLTSASIKHTANARARIASLSSVIDSAVSVQQRVSEQLGALAMATVDRDIALQIVCQYLGIQTHNHAGRIVADDATTTQQITRCRQIMDLVTNGRGNVVEEASEPTLWNVFNGLTEYETWNHGHNEQTRHDSILSGARLARVWSVVSAALPV